MIKRFPLAVCLLSVLLLCTGCGKSQLPPRTPREVVASEKQLLDTFTMADIAERCSDVMCVRIVDATQRSDYSENFGEETWTVTAQELTAEVVTAMDKEKDGRRLILHAYHSYASQDGSETLYTAYHRRWSDTIAFDEGKELWLFGLTMDDGIGYITVDEAQGMCLLWEDVT